MYHKATNAAVCDRWAIKNNCQNDSSLIIYTMWDIVHWNYITSHNIPRFDKAWKILSIYVFMTYIFLFVQYSHRVSQFPALRSGHKTASVTEVPDELEMGNCNYRRPNMAMGNSNGTDNVHLNNVNMMFE